MHRLQEVAVGWPTILRPRCANPVLAVCAAGDLAGLSRERYGVWADHPEPPDPEVLHTEPEHRDEARQRDLLTPADDVLAGLGERPPRHDRQQEVSEEAALRPGRDQEVRRVGDAPRTQLQG